MNEMFTIFTQIKEQYLTLLVFLSIVPTIYVILFAIQEKDERGQKITSTAYQFTYLFSVACVFILFLINRVYQLTFEDFRGGVIAVLLLANFFLGAMLFILNKRN